ncbi:hypothetical protein BOX15_Mlig028521g2 [Macrostomum lignano]|uniref:Uncharacterized protein n=1 Tax=Macrostomum lignano TaxID=282301 RepID=A0A267DUW3_9PLAT|nr:hypothetical protein BOX15_Mlig028521g2 [Macrostomum lignano]
MTGIQELTVSVPKPGYCGRDWLAFNGRCFFISSKPIALKEIDEAWMKYRAPRLAVFENSAEIKAFLLANKNRANEAPYRPPLDLSSPVRVGLFRCSAGTRQCFNYWKPQANGCLTVTKFNDSKPMLFQENRTIATSSSRCEMCAILKLKSTTTTYNKQQLEPVLMASDCLTAVHSLLAFEESPQIGRSEACPADNQCNDGADYSSLYSAACGSGSEAGQSDAYVNIFIVVGGGVGTLFFVSIFIVFRHFYINRTCRRRHSVQPPQQLAADENLLQERQSLDPTA